VNNESASGAGGLSGGLGGIAAPALDGYLLSFSLHPLPNFLNACLFAVVASRRRDYRRRAACMPSPGRPIHRLIHRRRFL